MSRPSGFVFKGISHLNSKNVQSLITMGKGRSLGNILWLYNFRVFDTIKFVTFHKSWGHILEYYAKAKVPSFPSKFNFSTKNLKKLTALWSSYMVGV